METTITLTFEELIELMAKYLAGRVKTGGIECSCGIVIEGTKESLQRHIRHIIQWGLDE